MVSDLCGVAFHPVHRVLGEVLDTVGLGRAGRQAVRAARARAADLISRHEGADRRGC